MNKLQAYLCSSVTVETAFQHFFCAGCENCPARGYCHAQPSGTCCRENFLQWAGEETAEPTNEPLTLEELRGMDGEPVWIVEHPDWGHWELSECAEDYFDDRDPDFYGMTMPPTLPDPMGRYGLHVLGWLAYRRKPNGGGE